MTQLKTVDDKLYFVQDDKIVSPFHDITLLTSGDDKSTFNFICEIPRNTKAKMEISKTIKSNPIVQDVKNGKPRFVNYKDGYPFNYGAFPQTWENPHYTYPDVGYKGDNDPIDVVEIGTTDLSCGQIVPVKVLGSLAMIDDGETDWKIITISTSDPLSEKYNDITDVPKEDLDEILDWFKMYKTVAGKEPNEFAFDEKYLDHAFTMKIIDESHDFWKQLVNGEVDPAGIVL